MTPEQKRSLNVVMTAFYTHQSALYNQFVFDVEKTLHPTFKNGIRNQITVTKRNAKLYESLVPKEVIEELSAKLDDVIREFVERNIQIEP